jgi:integrating conjugative element protein (TIGR03761 family)
MNKMKRGSEQDDPYSDWWMLRIEDKLDQTRTTLQTLREQVDQALAGVPAALSLGENLNVQPVKLPLFVNAQLGFAAVYLLADYDDIARKLILAHHTALIDRSTLERWLNEGAHALRSLFSLAQQYRYSGCTRDDFAAKNAAARARWRSSASCRRTCSKARAARSLRHPSCAVVCNSAVRILPQPLPASMVMRPLLPTRPKAQPLPARTNPHERSEPADPLLPGPATGSLHAPGTRGLSKGLLKPFKGKGTWRPGPASASPCATS